MRGERGRFSLLLRDESLVMRGILKTLINQIVPHGHSSIGARWRQGYWLAGYTSVNADPRATALIHRHSPNSNPGVTRGVHFTPRVTLSVTASDAVTREENFDPRAMQYKFFFQSNLLPRLRNSRGEFHPASQTARGAADGVTRGMKFTPRVPSGFAPILKQGIRKIHTKTKES